VTDAERAERRRREEAFAYIDAAVTWEERAIRKAEMLWVVYGAGPDAFKKWVDAYAAPSEEE
jgi:hypothetical protein